MVTEHDEGGDLVGQTHVVLLRPRWARNLGSVARAMKNFGLHKLTIVESQIGSWSDAWQMAVHAGDVLEDAVQTDDLEATLAGAHWVVGTTNNPPASVRVLTPREVAEEARRRGPPTLLFGGEINGLDPAELLRCHAVSVVPTAPEQSSRMVFCPLVLSGTLNVRPFQRTSQLDGCSTSTRLSDISFVALRLWLDDE